jgi:L-alanine-DL-glutamate epimerase-like enolase superfamily enzyme
MIWDLFEESFDIRPDGMVYAPERPGLGFTLRPDAMQHFTYLPGPEYEW